MEHIFGRGPKGPAAPARGAVAGVKADLERAKEGFDARNPNGVGMAWTHNFLNQKPWHPMSFKNRMRVFEAQQEKTDTDKAKEKAQAEFDAEQEYLKTLSYLSAEEQQRYREVQSVSFMYTKPPGLDAALARDAEMEKKKPPQQLAGPGGAGAGAAAGGAPPGRADAADGSARRDAGATAAGGGGGGGGPSADPQQQRSAMVARLREDPYTAMVAARQALLNNPRLAISRHPESGSFGGFSVDAQNQQLLGEEPGSSGTGVDAELEFLLSLPADQQLRALKRIAKRRKKEEQERQLREAEAVLRAAGYDLAAVAAEAGAGGGGSGSGRRSSKHKKKRSKGHKHKEEEDKSRKAKKRRRGSSESDPSSSSSPGSSPAR